MEPIELQQATNVEATSDGSTLLPLSAAQRSIWSHLQVAPDRLRGYQLVS